LQELGTLGLNFHNAKYLSCSLLKYNESSWIWFLWARRGSLESIKFTSTLFKLWSVFRVIM